MFYCYNCPRYNQLLQDWREAISRLREVCEEFQERGGPSLERELRKAKEECRKRKEVYREFVCERIYDKGSRKERINADLEEVSLDQNTPWEVIEILSQVPDGEFDLTNIKQEYKDRIVHWKGSIKDYSTGDISYKNLQTVGRRLLATNAQSFSADNLQTVIGFLDAQNTQSFSAKSLQMVGGDLYATNAQSFSADNLQTVGRYLDARSAQVFSAKSLTQVEQIRLKRAHFADENGQIDFEKLEREKRLVLPEETREKIRWV